MFCITTNFIYNVEFALSVVSALKRALELRVSSLSSATLRSLLPLPPTARHTVLCVLPGLPQCAGHAWVARASQVWALNPESTFWPCNLGKDFLNLSFPIS